MPKARLFKPRWAAALVLGLIAHFAQAQDIEITAEYRNSETNEEFRNTTPQSGYCIQWWCSDDMFSVDLHLEYERQVLSGLPPLPDRWSIQLPGQRTVVVTSAAGDTGRLQFQITHFAQELVGDTPAEDMDNPASHVSAGGGCTWVTGGGADGGINQSSFAWQVNNPVNPGLCYPTSADTTDQHPVTMRAAYSSIAYKLILPKPHTLASGIYRGSVTYTVGENGDFALGSKATGLSTNSITFNFTLTVHHELSVQFPANSDRVILEPPSGGWQRWLSSGTVPEKLQATLPYRLTVSGPFRMVMHCGEVGTTPGSCVIRNKRTGKASQFWTKVNPPGPLNTQPFYIADGQVVQFRAQRYVRNVPGSFSFEMYSPYIEVMLASPGDDWEGLVTLVFDASI